MDNWYRREQGVLVGGPYNCEQSFPTEKLPDDHPDVVAFLSSRMPIDLSDLDNLPKAFKAFGLLLRDYTNALQAGTHQQKTVAQLKADFKAKWDSLP